MGGGEGIDTRAKILGPWILIFMVSSRIIVDMEIFGDSKIIIDWAEGKGGFHVLVRKNT